MGSPALVDKIEIQVLIDNATDSLSTIHAHAESEFAYLERHGMRELSGDSLCCACHGLSLVITATRRAQRHTVLFDSGPEEYAFECNSSRLDVDLGIVESAAIPAGLTWIWASSRALCCPTDTGIMPEEC